MSHLISITMDTQMWLWKWWGNRNKPNVAPSSSRAHLGHQLDASGGGRVSRPCVWASLASRRQIWARWMAKVIQRKDQRGTFNYFAGLEWSQLTCAAQTGEGLRDGVMGKVMTRCQIKRAGKLDWTEREGDIFRRAEKWLKDVQDNIHGVVIILPPCLYRSWARFNSWLTHAECFLLTILWQNNPDINALSWLYV